jgi:hypothetical protein
MLDFSLYRAAPHRPHPEEREARLEGWAAGSHGSPGDAQHRPETALARPLTMRGESELWQIQHDGQIISDFHKSRQARESKIFR